MRPLLVLMILALFFVGLPEPLCAQKVYRIAVLLTDGQFIRVVEGFQNKMTAMGYHEEKNIEYIVYNAQREKKTLENLAEKLAWAGLDAILVASTTATLPVARLTAGTDLPVVFIGGGNPLEFVKSYASSGNNLTGISAAGLDLTAKRLELLKQLAPEVKKVVSFNNPKGVNYEQNRVAVRKASQRLQLAIVEVNASDREGLQKVAAGISRKVADAIFLPPDTTISKEIEVIITQSIKAKLPLIPSFPAYVVEGGLASYGPDYFSLGQQGAVLVDKILKGARPMDLPIEQPNKLSLVINLKTAKAIGLSIPKEILLRADEVIQ